MGLCSLPIYLGPNYGGGDEDNGDLPHKVPCTTNTQCPQSCSRPPPTRTSARDSWTPTGKSRTVSCGVTAPFSWVLVHKVLLCPPRVYFPDCISSGSSMVGLMVTSCIFLGCKITADGDCSHEIKRRLLLAMTNLDSILKSRDITLPTKVHLVKAMVFPVVMHGCERWTIMKTEHQRINAFELWCWRRLLRVPWTTARSNQSILKEISPGCSLEGLMLKLKLQYFGQLMWRADSF